jgi:hypothetical protein
MYLIFYAILSQRYYTIFHLVRIGIPQHEVVLIYCAIIRSVLEYACAVWLAGLTTAQSEDLELLQKRSMRINYPELLCNDALLTSGLDKLSDRLKKYFAACIKKFSNLFMYCITCYYLGLHTVLKLETSIYITYLQLKLNVTRLLLYLPPGSLECGPELCPSGSNLGHIS